MIRLNSNLLWTDPKDPVESVKSKLRVAIQLEHATIPPYLYAMYSLGMAPINARVAAIIKSVVVEEMLHMTLACNVLNALNECPNIASPDFPAKYPGHLPGGIEGSLIVGLEPFSIDVVKRTFMEIEAPEKPLDFEDPTGRTHDPSAEGISIGEFYTQLIEDLEDLRKKGYEPFTGDHKRQVQPPFPEGSIVTGYDSAIASLKLIIDQGEGSTASPLEDPTHSHGHPANSYAHYYRFAEIYHGWTLVPNPNAKPSDPPEKQYLFGDRANGSKVVTFDRSLVAKIPTNPKAAHYPAGSAQRHAIDGFNYTYTSVLKGLNAAFNGNPGALGPAINAMMSLRQQALDMMAGVNLPEPVGPSFEYQPMNPA